MHDSGAFASSLSLPIRRHLGRCQAETPLSASVQIPQATSAAAGVILASKLRIGQASVGLEFLLPALVGAFLGSTTIKPGRVNVWGTLVGVVILAIRISGIQQLGGSFWGEPMFNGLTLLVAIGIAGYAQRKRVTASRSPSTGGPATPARRGS